MNHTEPLPHLINRKKRLPSDQWKIFKGHSTQLPKLAQNSQERKSKSGSKPGAGCKVTTTIASLFIRPEVTGASICHESMSTQPKKRDKPRKSAAFKNLHVLSFRTS